MGIKRFDYRYEENRSPKVIEFLKELKKLQKKYKLSLSHEDSHGSFEIIPWDQRNEYWVDCAAEVIERN